MLLPFWRFDFSLFQKCFALMLLNFAYFHVQFHQNFDFVFQVLQFGEANLGEEDEAEAATIRGRRMFAAEDSVSLAFLEDLLKEDIEIRVSLVLFYYFSNSLLNRSSIIIFIRESTLLWCPDFLRRTD